MSALGQKQTYAVHKLMSAWANSGHALEDIRQIIDDPELRTTPVWHEAA